LTLVFLLSISQKSLALAFVAEPTNALHAQTLNCIFCFN